MVAMVCGAAVLAVWTDARFPSLQPRLFLNRMINVAAAAGVLRVVPFPADPPALQLVVLFGVVLPALVWAFFGAIGLLRYLCAAALRG